MDYTIRASRPNSHLLAKRTLESLSINSKTPTRILRCGAASSTMLRKLNNIPCGAEPYTLGSCGASKMVAKPCWWSGMETTIPSAYMRAPFRSVAGGNSTLECWSQIVYLFDIYRSICVVRNTWAQPPAKHIYDVHAKRGLFAWSSSQRSTPSWADLRGAGHGMDESEKAHDGEC